MEARELLLADLAIVGPFRPPLRRIAKPGRNRAFHRVVMSFLSSLRRIVRSEPNEAARTRTTRIPVIAVRFAATALSCMVAAGIAEAKTYTFSYSGACADSCAAYASITPGYGTLSITLEDPQVNPGVTQGDAISGVQFTTSVSSATAILLSQTGSLININSNGTYSSVSGNPTNWSASASGKSITLTTIGGGRPIDMIIGGPGSGGVYKNTALSSYNPYILGTATFTLIDVNITPSTVISSLSFMFGTKPNYIVSASIPEPGSLWVTVAALAGLAVMVARSRSGATPKTKARTPCSDRLRPKTAA